MKKAKHAVQSESSSRKHSDVVKYVNVRPDGVDTLQGDCTTRCISYCLGISYLQVRNEQHLWADSANEEWNGCDFWDTMLRKRGWRRIYFPKPITRWRVAIASAQLDNPIATSSRGHVCPVHMGKVIDMGETQLQRVEYVVCRQEDYNHAKKLLKPLIVAAKQAIKKKKNKVKLSRKRRSRG